jgi:hypothetical protein
MGKPTTAAGYSLDQLELVRRVCLYVATVLGDLMDSLVVVGGLAPSFLIDQEHLPAGADRHPGTLDLDVGLHVGVLDEKLYATIAERLRTARFEPAPNEKGNTSRQRWHMRAVPQAAVDFLIAPTLPGDRGGGTRDLETDFAALIAPGLSLAFRDRISVVLRGKTILDENAERTIHVAGPGAFVVLKALSFENRGENKDAFDLFYVLRNFDEGVDDVAARLVPLLDDHYAKRAVDVLRRDFTDPNGVGARRVAEFLFGRPDDELQQDVVGIVSRLLDTVAPKKRRSRSKPP